LKNGPSAGSATSGIMKRNAPFQQARAGFIEALRND
jgi:hypothetical protein